MKSLFNLLFLAAVLTFIGCDSSKKTAEVAVEETKEMTKPATATVAPGTIGFKAANQRYSADGSFQDWNFTNIDMKGGVESLNADLEIRLASVSEKAEKLANHLRASDYFDVAKYATATANISNVRKSDDGYIADLTLEMRGAKQVIESPFTVVSKKPLHVKGTADVDRRIFKIGTDEAGNYTGRDNAGDVITVTYDTDVKL